MECNYKLQKIDIKSFTCCCFDDHVIVSMT